MTVEGLHGMQSSFATMYVDLIICAGQQCSRLLHLIWPYFLNRDKIEKEEFYNFWLSLAQKSLLLSYQGAQFFSLTYVEMTISNFFIWKWRFFKHSAEADTYTLIPMNTYTSSWDWRVTTGAFVFDGNASSHQTIEIHPRKCVHQCQV